MGKRFSGLTLSWRVSLLIAALLIVSAIVTIGYAFRSVEAGLYATSQEGVDNIHTSVSEAVQSDYEGIRAFREETLKKRKQVLRDVAAPLVVSLDQLRSAAKSGELTEAQAQRRALALLKSVRFANDDYFFTYDRQLNAISHPDPKFQGRNLADMQDADGTYVLREIRRVALQRGSGFVDYRWKRLNSDVPSPKIGYVFHYEPWDWIIGTGVYVDDIDAEVATRIEAIKANLTRSFRDISFNRDGFFFILDREGRLVASASPVLASYQQTPQGQQTLQQVADAAPAAPGQSTETVIEAPWAQSESEPWSVRMSSTGGDLDWILVSAVPQEDLEAPGSQLALRLALLSLAVLLIGLALGLLVSRRITRPVDDLSAAARSLSSGTFEPAMLDAAASRSDELGELARSFQSMGAEVVERERRLREQIEKLTVSIDRAKVREEVEQITESDYFQKLKSRSQEMRRRDG